MNKRRRYKAHRRRAARTVCRRVQDTMKARGGTFTDLQTHETVGCTCETCTRWRQGIYNSGRWPRPRQYNGERG